MPEAKNTFLKAKMNQDLDDRLLPNGEYRTAQNVLVGKSEEDNVGTLQNIRGNEIISGLTIPQNTFIIGYFMDKVNQKIYAFFTDNNTSHSIRVYTVNGTWETLVQGEFLNFSTAYPILNVNLLEDLLFWTDNNNQPRKINVTHSLGYYTKEHQISVAKYNPYQPILLVKQEIEEVLGTPTVTVFDVAENANIVPGMIVVSKRGTTSVINGSDYITVDSASTGNNITTVTLSSAAPSIDAGDIMYFLSSTMTDESADAQWPGDPSYLESRFVRFSYRFKFDDNEYSIFAPFTQIAFIPKQKGYFVNGQEQLAVNSTILEWFENGINNIELIIPLPDKAENINSNYKIKEIDILYKESDQLSVKVLDTINVTDITNRTDTYYTYSYQSRKPIRTLPEAQTVRVYDKVPVKAKTQEIISNRIVYGNFRTKHTPPDIINYTVNIEEKRTNGGFSNFVEYPNHTVKQNRTYQVGFVLSDKYGRQSDVILSPVSEASENKGSTIFAPYIPDDPPGSGTPDSNYMPNGVKDWAGNSLILNIQSPITGNDDTKIYAEELNNGFNIDTAFPPVINGSTYSFTLLGSDQTGIPAEGYYMRGQHVDYVKITQVTPLAQSAYQVTTDGQVNDVYLQDPESVDNDTKYVYKINPLGWYSYKIVVKQTEQEYYNVYLPSAINANNFPTNKTTDTAASVSYIALINDNINKVPRDLAEVGPDQKQYRSSVRLFGRVQPTFATGPIFGNQQYFPLRTADTSTAVGNTDDILGEGLDNSDSVFQYDSNPIVARISTNKQFGIDATDFGATTDRFSLAIFETEPVVSALDIYWETSQAGLISDLNLKTLTGFGGPTGFDGFEDLFAEDVPANDPVSTYFQPLKADGTNLTNFEISIHSVVDGNNNPITGKFDIEADPNNSDSYRIILLENEVFVFDSDSRDEYTIIFRIIDNFPNSEWVSADLPLTLKLSNIDPSFSEQQENEFYIFDEEATTATIIHDFRDNDWQNGSATNSTEGLKWSISGSNAYLFNINYITGELTPTQAGVDTGLNTYPIDVTLSDASNPQGQLGEGSRSVTQTYNIVKGYPQWNGEQKRAIGTIEPIFQFDYNDSSNYQESYHCYYMTNQGSIADTNLPPFNTNLFSNYAQQAPLTPADGKTRFVAEKIGPRHETGAFLFGIEYAQILNFGLCNETQEAHCVAKAYYRTSTSGTWIEAQDLNNTNSLEINVRQPEGGTPLPGYAWFAQDKNVISPSADFIEWAFVIRTEGIDNLFQGPRPPGCEPTVGDPISFTAKPTVRDLHYNSPTQTQAIYTYRVFENGGAATAETADYGGGSGTEVYSDNPLVETNEKFFTDQNFSVIWQPSSTQYYIVRYITGPGATNGCTNTDRTALNTNSPPAQMEGIMKINTDGIVDRALEPVVRPGIVGAPNNIRIDNNFNTRITDCNGDTNTYFELQLFGPG